LNPFAILSGNSTVKELQEERALVAGLLPK
jgi:hypothetical protein